MEPTSPNQALPLLTTLCGLRLGRAFARFPLTDASLEDDDFRNLDHLLGSTHFRPVPWEAQ